VSGALSGDLGVPVRACFVAAQIDALARTTTKAETVRFIESANLQRRDLDPGLRVILIIKLPATRPAASARLSGPPLREDA
jgi:hypothetical protein